MAVNRDKPDRWKSDISKSVDFFNAWFMMFAPKAFRETRVSATRAVEDAMGWTENLTNITTTVLREHPRLIEMLRMSTCPPLARDRLIGLSGVSKGLVVYMERRDALPPKTPAEAFEREAKKLISTIQDLIDPDIFTWSARNATPSKKDVHRAATIVADRLCGAQADPIVRNAQEARQLKLLAKWLEKRGYNRVHKGARIDNLGSGTYAFRMNVPVKIAGIERPVNIPIDAAVMPKTGKRESLPLLLEAKSAGDFTNVNKRRKEEATKMVQLRKNYGEGVQFVLLLCGYFDSGYLGYEAAEGIDWVWEHRIEDLGEFGL